MSKCEWIMSVGWVACGSPATHRDALIHRTYCEVHAEYLIDLFGDGVIVKLPSSTETDGGGGMNPELQQAIEWARNEISANNEAWERLKMVGRHDEADIYEEQSEHIKTLIEAAERLEMCSLCREDNQ